MGLEISKDSER